MPSPRIDDMLAHGERLGIPAPPPDRRYSKAKHQGKGHGPRRPMRSRAFNEWWAAVLIALREEKGRRRPGSTLPWREQVAKRKAIHEQRDRELGRAPVVDSVGDVWLDLARRFPGFACDKCGARESPGKWGDPGLAEALHKARTCWDCRERAMWEAAPGVVAGVVAGVRVIPS